MKEKILGINVSITDYQKIIDDIKKSIDKKEKKTIIAINPEKILKAKENDEIKKILNKADYQIPDGIGVIYASKLKKGKIKSRITGIDLMDKICLLANNEKYKIFLYGAEEEVVKKAKKCLEQKYSNIKIVGYLNGYVNDLDKIIKTINKSKADILFVALGSPKQERWIIQNKEKIDAYVLQGVGGSFDVISGNIKRAPIWMQKYGLEWLYRILKEPKRILRQIKILKFLFIAIRR